METNLVNAKKNQYNPYQKSLESSKEFKTNQIPLRAAQNFIGDNNKKRTLTTEENRVSATHQVHQNPYQSLDKQ